MTDDAALDSAPATVLVIDDDDSTRYLLASWLRRGGHTVIEAVDGAQGLALMAAQHTPPEVALIDVRLPDMSGFEVCERIKSAPGTAGLPVIHVSACAITPEHHAEGLRRGADAYLDQPIDRDELLATVTASLRYARVRRRAERLADRLTTLNRTTLDVYRAIGFHSFTAAATGGAAALMSCAASAVFLSPQGQAVHSQVTGPGETPRSLPAGADLLKQLAAPLGSATGAATVRVRRARWKALLPDDHLDGDVAVVLARTQAGRPPTCLAIPADAVRGTEDEELFQQLAHACALSLEALRSYNDEHSLALALQRTFLPARLPVVPGLDLAFRYRPASDHAEIGGDFYEALETASGTLLAIGDVAGHSLAAATVMGEIRHALRAYGVEGHAPHQVLDRLENLMAYSQPGITVTMCLILVEPGGRRIQVANAGHIPPLMLGPDGKAAFLHEHGPLLGLGVAHPPSTPHETAPGTRLVLITDGLVEERSRDLDDSLADFLSAAARGPADPEALCDALLLAFGEDRDDDIALLTARLG
ncbi:SpoIIE family protein phosphatase [Streptantibioticus silvisoli]|uniref:SpoIIE family protein phosphatase n=1 Tax=Streptantibioticus silvisoli TaxID=2705255 RepID=A0ABT6W156_9ACTN|nr:SpoIIE family protein phosphatase [Streptantibioticus silvisoli]MDI5964481.1 SpoIIE family protein phosphatase [Streptantibioticus silvisoli]